MKRPTRLQETKPKEGENKLSVEVHLRYYVPWTKGDINPTLANAPQKYASWYYQLKVGHGAVGTFLARIGVIKPSECWWCGEAEQSVEHLYT